MRTYKLSHDSLMAMIFAITIANEYVRTKKFDTEEKKQEYEDIIYKAQQAVKRTVFNWKQVELEK